MVEQTLCDQDAPQARIASSERRLKWIRWAGVLDLILLIALVTASLTGNREWVRILGPLHGGNFLLLLTLTFVGASDRLWSWGFPAAVALTGGPIGALVGEWLVSRRLKRERTLSTANGEAS
jgi:hypothetical protein